jgi:hypothetical protein
LHFYFLYCWEDFICTTNFILSVLDFLIPYTFVYAAFLLIILFPILHYLFFPEPTVLYMSCKYLTSPLDCKVLEVSYLFPLFLCVCMHIKILYMDLYSDVHSFPTELFVIIKYDCYIAWHSMIKIMPDYQLHAEHLENFRGVCIAVLWISCRNYLAKHWSYSIVPKFFMCLSLSLDQEYVIHLMFPIQYIVFYTEYVLSK